MINAAIVGMGRWGQLLVDSVAGKSDAIRFVAGTTRTLSRVEDFAKDRGLRLHGSYADVLGDPEVDAVVLATPHTQHYGQMIAAAEAGKHVLCEKPFTLTGAEARQALDALEARGLTVAVGHNRRYAPNAVALKQMIDAGVLGDPIQIEGNFSANMTGAAGQWRDSRQESPAGGMTSLGIHVLDMMICLFGRIESVYAVSRRVAIPYDIDDATGVLMDFEDGQLGYLGTVSASASLFTVRVHGLGGWAEIFALDRLHVGRSDGSEDIRTWEGYGYPGVKTVAAELEGFAAACEGGKPFAVTPDEIQHGIAVLEAIIKSAESGERVAVG